MKKITSLLHKLPGWTNSVSARWSWRFLLIIALLALIGPWIANEKPYYCKLDGKRYYPIFSKVSEASLSATHAAHSPVDWHTTVFESIIRAPVPYSHHTIDLKSGGHVSPFSTQSIPLRFRHWLGTDPLGRDVLAGMIRGCRISLLIGVGSMLLALLIGVPVGSAAAYWGNRAWGLTWMQFGFTCIGIIFLACIVWMPLNGLSKMTGMLVVLLISAIGLRVLGKMKSNQIHIPLDHIVMSVISALDSFPGLFIIMLLLFIIPVKGWVVVLGAIALLRWPVMARYMRAEVYKMKERNFIKAAQLLNFPDLYIIRKHIIPYAFRPVMISFIFGVSSAILAESSLSFLGIGLPAEEVNWGRLLSQSRNHLDAWWLVFFPGFAIFFTLLSLYAIGNAVEKIQKSETYIAN